MAPTLLVTGGAGYIGSHTCVQLLEEGHDVVVLDNLENSCAEALDRVREITGKELTFYQDDMLDPAALETIFRTHSFDAVLHFAGLKAVGESKEVPLRYYHNNVTGTLHLLDTMKRHGVRDIVFSSSATVYGDPASVPITEDFPLVATNPYGRTKLMIEEILRDLCAADTSWRAILLRYFNPVGAHPSGRIGEDPQGIPNNLMPFVMQVAVGKHPRVQVFGDDYPTPDGTGVRDYIHVVDLARGHLAALDALPETAGCAVYNLGTGKGYSVLEMIEAASRAVGREIPHDVTARRPGDVAQCYADPSKAARVLRWSAKLGLDEMCADAWRWQKANPHGYGVSRGAVRAG